NWAFWHIEVELPINIIGTNLLTKFHEDWKINVASRENASPPGSHVFQPTGINFELVQYIIGMNLLTKFHEDQKINVTSRVLTRKNALPPWWPYIIGMYLLTEFHEDWTINVATREKCPAPGDHVFKETITIFDFIQDIIGTNLLTKKNAPPLRASFFMIWMNLLTKFHEDRTINVASRVNNALPLCSHVFQANITIFELIQDINKTNLLTIFNEDWTINVASRVLTRKNALPPGGHVLKETKDIFETIQDIIGTNLLTKFHEDRKKNVASRVLTRKNAPPPGGHVFQPTVIIFKLFQDIIGMVLLIKFHEDWTINLASRLKNAPPLGIHFSSKDIIRTNLSKFHEDRKINVASRVLTRKNAPPPGGHVFQPTGIIFELIQDNIFIGMNLLTKFHEDQTINVASRVKNAPPLGSHVFQANFTRQMLTPHDGQQTKGDHKS
ncbi:hypothetical protein DPMN_157170, partial [Dreissena polymorpha]